MAKTITHTVHPLEFHRLTQAQQALLRDAWNWLESAGIPWEVKTESRYLFAYHGPTPVAVLEVRDYPDPDMNWTWVQILYTVAPYRKKGYGKLLLQHVKGYFKRPGGKIGLGTCADNAPMQQLATQLRFAQAYEFWHTYPEK